MLARTCERVSNRELTADQVTTRIGRAAQIQGAFPPTGM
jgi:hypothetical protein